MKTTGEIRRIDDIGRVIIPRNVRRELRLHEGTPLEIFTDGRMLCLKPVNEGFRYKKELLAFGRSIWKSMNIQVDFQDPDGVESFIFAQNGKMTVDNELIVSAKMSKRPVFMTNQAIVPIYIKDDCDQQMCISIMVIDNVTEDSKEVPILANMAVGFLQSLYRI